MRGAPPLATITGSSTSGIAGARASSTAATVSITPLSCSMPVLTASAPISASTTSICCRIKAGSIGRTPWTPSVFCAVNAVIAVAAKASSIVTVLMSAWIPAPPPESEPATMRTRPFTGLFRGLDGARLVGAAGGGEDRLADVVDDQGEQPFVLALRHHPDHRLGAGRADDEPSVRAQPSFAGGDRLLDPARLQRQPLAEAEVAQELRHRREEPADIARLLPGLDDARHDLQRRDQSVAGRRVVRKDDVC